VAAALAWAHRSLLDTSAWGLFTLDERNFVALCGGCTLPPSGADTALLQSLRLNRVAVDIHRSIFPDAMEVSADYLRALSGRTPLPFGDCDSAGQSSLTVDLLCGPLPGTHGEGGTRGSFVTLCQKFAVEAGKDSAARFKALRSHFLLWGTAPPGSPHLSEEGFFAAVARGNHISRKSSRADLGWSTGDTLLRDLARVFNASGMASLDAPPDVAAGLLFAGLREEGEPLPADPDCTAGVGAGGSPDPTSNQSSLRH
jgi:hypothetical protein